MRESYRVRYIVLLVLFVLAFGIQARLSIALLGDLFTPDKVAGDVASIEDGSNRVAAVTDAAVRAGLRVGDRIVTVGDRHYEGEGQLNSAIAALGPGGHLQIDYEREGRREAAMLVVPPGAYVTRTSALIGLIYRFATPFLCLTLGFFVAFRRIFDRVAWLLLFLMLSFSQASSGSSLVRYALGWSDLMRPVAIVFTSALLVSWPIAMLWFGVYFPERSRIDRVAPWLKWVMVAPVAVWGVVRVAVSFFSVENWRLALPLMPLHDWLTPYIFILFVIPISGFFWQLGEKSGTIAGIDARRRLKLIWVGTTVSLLPSFFVNLAGAVWHVDFERMPRQLIVPALLLQFLFPVTLAYVIVVQRAMDVGMAVRQGLQYAMARSGVAVIRVLILASVVMFTVGESVRNELTGARLFVVIILSVIVVTVLGRLTAGLSTWVDRRFFREAYQSEQILADLSDEVRTIVETRPLLETVANRIAASLHVPKIAILLQSDGAFRPALVRGYEPVPGIAFAPESTVVARLRTATRPLTVYTNDPESWTADLAAYETGQIERLGAELMLPLTAKDKLHGFIALGAKQSEAPYSATDLKLLHSVAVQTGLALENAHLTAAVADEVARRERLNRELEIAREVQERLFPQRYPAVDGLRYAGRCRPAQSVGGDYYDFVEVPGGHFGIAIGDVSGKGIPAALLMASLQASLRGQAISSPRDLAALMSNMNRLIFDTSPSNRYATFFYGQYEPATRELVYVNGGHNAPMVLRGGDVLRLEAGGPVVGLFAAAKYTEGRITLEAGDTVAAFTDGISEAMNPADDEFGDDRIVGAVRGAAAAGPEGVLDRLFAAADEFAAGAPQHDDMTAVVIRVA